MNRRILVDQIFCSTIVGQKERFVYTRLIEKLIPQTKYQQFDTGFSRFRPIHNFLVDRNFLICVCLFYRCMGRKRKRNSTGCSNLVKTRLTNRKNCFRVDGNQCDCAPKTKPRKKRKIYILYHVIVVSLSCAMECVDEYCLLPSDQG